MKQKVVKKKAVYQSQMVENFESYTAGTDWGNYTLGEGLTSGGNEPAHYLAKGETMKVITDPENANNKVLQVIPKFYSFCPVFTVDLEKLTGISAKKLGDYKGILRKSRVVSDASRHVGIGTTHSLAKQAHDIKNMHLTHIPHRAMPFQMRKSIINSIIQRVW